MVVCGKPLFPLYSFCVRILSPYFCVFALCSMHHWCTCMCLFDPGDAVWHAGGRPSGLAEKHSVPSLHKEQQADHLVLAGTVTQPDIMSRVLHPLLLIMERIWILCQHKFRCDGTVHQERPKVPKRKKRAVCFWLDCSDAKVIHCLSVDLHSQKKKKITGENKTTFVCCSMF